METHMEVRLKYLGLNTVFLPIVLYFVWNALGEIESGFFSFFSVSISCLGGVALATFYGEVFAERIKKFYLIVTLVFGLSFLVLLYVIKLDRFPFVDVSSFNIAFFVVAVSYKEEVLAKIRAKKKS
jgi:hypothetical protein